MCVSPSRLPSGVVVGCRRCWQCRANRVSDWVGRNIAETKMATQSYSVRLSYGRDRDGHADHLRSVFLTVSDHQKFVKRLRKAGYDVKYMVAGEYGSDLGRAHWHGIYHFYGDVLPDWDGAHLTWSEDQWKRVGGIHIPEWAEDGRPIGHVHIKKAHYAHMRYALKYMLKDQFDPMQQSKFFMSKYPPLGYEYFVRLARETAMAALSPRDLKYRFPIVTYDGTQKTGEFMLRGKMAEIYLQSFVDEWRRLYGNDDWPESEVVGAWVRFGKLGKPEYLLEGYIREAEADAKFAKLQEKEDQRRINSMLFGSANHVRLDVKSELAEWERKYFGQTWEQFERPGPEFNDPATVAGILDRWRCSESEFWSLPTEHVIRIWDEHNAYLAQRRGK